MGMTMYFFSHLDFIIDINTTRKGNFDQAKSYKPNSMLIQLVEGRKQDRSDKDIMFFCIWFERELKPMEIKYSITSNNELSSI